MTPALVGILLECPEGLDPCGFGKICDTFYYVSLNEAKCLYRELEVVSRDMTPKAFLDYTIGVFCSVAALMGGEGGKRVSAAAAMNKQGHLVRQTFSSALAVSGIHVQAINVESPLKRPRVQPNAPGPGGDGSSKPTIERMMGGIPASKFPCQRDACGADSMCNRTHEGKVAQAPSSAVRGRGRGRGARGARGAGGRGGGGRKAAQAQPEQFTDA